MTIIEMFRKEKFPKLKPYLKEYGVYGVLQIICTETYTDSSFLRDWCFALGLKKSVGSQVDSRGLLRTARFVAEIYPDGLNMNQAQYLSMLGPASGRLRMISFSSIIDEFGIVDGCDIEKRFIHEVILLTMKCYAAIAVGSPDEFAITDTMMRIDDKWFDFYGRELNI